jgi:hypothetical protein
MITRCPKAKCSSYLHRTQRDVELSEVEVASVHFIVGGLKDGDIRPWKREEKRP